MTELPTVFLLATIKKFKKKNGKNKNRIYLKFCLIQIRTKINIKSQIAVQVNCKANMKKKFFKKKKKIKKKKIFFNFFFKKRFQNTTFFLWSFFSWISSFIKNEKMWALIVCCIPVFLFFLAIDFQLKIFFNDFLVGLLIPVWKSSV